MSFTTRVYVLMLSAILIIIIVPKSTPIIFSLVFGLIIIGLKNMQGIKYNKDETYDELSIPLIDDKSLDEEITRLQGRGATPPIG